MVEIKKHSTRHIYKPGSSSWWVKNDKAPFFKDSVKSNCFRDQNAVVTVLEISYMWTEHQLFAVFIDGTGNFVLGFTGSGIMPQKSGHQKAYFSKIVVAHF